MIRGFAMQSTFGAMTVLLIGLSVRAAEPANLPDNHVGLFVSSGSGGCFQPTCESSTCTTCCNQGDCCCGGVHCCCGCGFYGGVEAAILRPSFNNNTALLGYTVSTASISAIDFSSNYNVSPRIWLGYMGPCGFGGRISYWQYDQAANAPPGVQSGTDVVYFAPGITTSIPSVNLGYMQTDLPGDTLSTSEHLHMYTLDAEVTQCLEICCWNVVFGGGLRDASVHVGRENILTPVGATVPYENATIDNNFDGVGPTAFAEFRRPFGGCGFAFVGSVRGSLLYGTKSLYVNDAYPNLMPTHTYQQSVDGCLGVAEFSLGLEWDRNFSGNRTVFAQCLWESQFWSNMGDSISPTGDSLGLTGFGIAVGIAR
jgi:hypothetical protein